MGFVWTMSLAQRVRLHNALLGAARGRTVRALGDALTTYRRLMLALRHVEEQESMSVLRGASVVGMTTTGAAKYQSLVRQMGCRVLLMEEAAEVLEAHV